MDSGSEVGVQTTKEGVRLFGSLVCLVVWSLWRERNMWVRSLRSTTGGHVGKKIWMRLGVGRRFSALLVACNLFLFRSGLSWSFFVFCEEGLSGSLFLYFMTFLLLLMKYVIYTLSKT